MDAEATIPEGHCWTLLLGSSYHMNVTLDADTTLTVNGSKGDDAGFHIANGSTLTNNDKIEVNSSMSIGTSGKVDGSGIITVNAGGVLEASVNSTGVVKTLENKLTIAGIFVWNSSTANSLTGTVTLTSGGKVYSNANLWRQAGSPQVNYLLPLDDVAAGAWYAEAVRWAASDGIVTGTSATSFAPGDPVTREQLAAILYRYAGYKGYDTSTGGMSLAAYTDANRISCYALTAMRWANGEGLITGKTSTTLDPKGTATRAEVATILMRFCEDVVK